MIIFLVIALVIGWSLFAFAAGVLMRRQTYHWLDSLFLNGKDVSMELKRHFVNVKTDDMLIVSRSFPNLAKIEIYQELQKILAEKNIIRASGINTQHFGNRMSDCLVDDGRPFTPFAFDELDIGEETPVRCPVNGLWLWKENGTPLALVFIPECDPSRPTFYVEIAVQKETAAASEIERIMNRLEQAVKECTSYRHKVISFESSENQYTGTGAVITVHRLNPITREQLILPEKTIDLLERNIFGFVERRHLLKERGLQMKKGLLFYGPPGTGKTHTLHYIINRLQNEYTTFIVTAEQVRLLGTYCQLARLVEPAIIIIEDADIIARDRSMFSDETPLNRLLNEMDGLKEDADIIFLLTTNRPEELEDAVRNRPGRIDQAIEFPKPDKQGRAKLAQLYAYGLELSPDVTEAITNRTEGASAAFIKELLRRSAQFLLERDLSSQRLETSDWENALNEMLTGSNFGVLKLEDQQKYVI